MDFVAGAYQSLYSQLLYFGIFYPALWTVAALTFSPVHFPPRPSLRE